MEKLSKSPVHAVVGIVWSGSRLLICERPKGKPYAGYWEFPGGKMEIQETSIQALQRELLEELGIRVTRADFILQHHHNYPDKKVILDLWKIIEYTGEPTAQEQQKIRWATVEEIKRLPLLEGNWSLLESIVQP